MFFSYYFYSYLFIQYKKATIKFYKQNNKFQKYVIAKKDYRKSTFKDNVTKKMNLSLVNSIAGYAVVELLDEYGRVQKSQTIFKPNLTIGRENSNDIVLSHQTVSRQQCLIRRQSGKFFLCNLSRTNPTMINGTELDNTIQLSFGDIIEMSIYKFRFNSAS